ncbi:hypothetical protein SRABI96_05316 [Peribacillus sp. Bi96]|uniref:hypothetical protein n=1 Tax=unclassified Peribacillus TaxID=2675266 RepID=UPI001D1FCD0E|nr:hypothetical protein [Peribacillus sp. Bi96]CAH0318011.1 hypothetical protein SRABI96_05316 [Peribacillus sp. Bi96]
MRTSYRRRTEYPYPGESIPPKGSPDAGNWPMFFIAKGSDCRANRLFNESPPFFKGKFAQILGI